MESWPFGENQTINLLSKYKYVKFIKNYFLRRMKAGRRRMRRGVGVGVGRGGMRGGGWGWRGRGVNAS